MEWRLLALIILINYAFFLYYDKRFKREKDCFVDELNKNYMRIFEKTREITASQHTTIEIMFDNQQKTLEKIHNFEEQIVSIGDMLNEIKKEIRKK